MKVNFIGSPASGKTTVASHVFNKLKTLGFSSEFITEQARLYIAEIRYNSKNKDHLVLSDEDQLVIMSRQLKIENIVKYSIHEESHLICDSSPLNSIFYMSSDLRKSSQVKDLIKETLESVDLVFYCEPVAQAVSVDPNRVHSVEESKAIDEQIFNILKEEAPELLSKIKTLKGNPSDRASKVMNALLGL